MFYIRNFGTSDLRTSSTWTNTYKFYSWSSIRVLTAGKTRSLSRHNASYSFQRESAFVRTTNDCNLLCSNRICIMPTEMIVEGTDKNGLKKSLPILSLHNDTLSTWQLNEVVSWEKNIVSYFVHFLIAFAITIKFYGPHQMYYYIRCNS